MNELRDKMKKWADTHPDYVRRAALAAYCMNQAVVLQLTIANIRISPEYWPRKYLK